MKRALWLTILLNLILAGVLAWRHWSFVPTPPDEELLQTPRAGNDVAVTPLAAPVAVNVEAMKATNLFDPERGKSKPTVTMAAAAPERPNFELVGICSLGESSGAIIDKKNEVAGDPRKVRRYYTLGSEVGSGFVLDSVMENMVILRRDGEVLELKVGRSRFGEQAKGSATLERTGTAAVPPEMPEMPVKTYDPIFAPQENNGGTQ